MVTVVLLIICSLLSLWIIDMNDKRVKIPDGTVHVFQNDFGEYELYLTSDIPIEEIASKSEITFRVHTRK